MIEAPSYATPSARIRGLIAGEQWVVLDGGVGTELIWVPGARPEVDSRDSVRTQFGEWERMLGGAATHFALAASFFDRVHVVGPVGRLQR